MVVRRRARTEELLALVGLDPAVHRDRYPAQLSGGERQRVGVARALAADPPILLMDEPFGAVDPIVRERLQNELLRLQEDLAKTILFVTHDIEEALVLADRIVLLSNKPTRVLDTITVEAARPRSLQHDERLRGLRDRLLDLFQTLEEDVDPTYEKTETTT